MRRVYTRNHRCQHPGVNYLQEHSDPASGRSESGAVSFIREMPLPVRVVATSKIGRKASLSRMATEVSVHGMPGRRTPSCLGLIPRFAMFWCTSREPMACPPSPDVLNKYRNVQRKTYVISKGFYIGGSKNGVRCGESVVGI